MMRHASTLKNYIGIFFYSRFRKKMNLSFEPISNAKAFFLNFFSINIKLIRANIYILRQNLRYIKQIFSQLFSS
jgi:hypothetical protein